MNKKIIFAVCAYILLFALFIAICIAISSCKILKKSSYKSSDSTSVSKDLSKGKLDSAGGSISKNNSISKELTDWWKTTVQFPVDTSSRTTNVYPSTIIYEGGKGQKEVQSDNTDSSWYSKKMETMQAKIDSLSTHKSEGESYKKSDISTKTLIFGVAALYLFVEVLKFISSRYKISKK